MKIEKISASGYKSHSHCETAFFIENILNWRFPPGKAANIGTIAHAILEIIAQIKVGRQENKSKIETEIGNINIGLGEFDIEEIKDKTYQLYINKEPFNNHKWSPKDLKDIKQYVDVVLNHNNGRFNPLNRNIIGTEQYFKFDIKDDWAILKDGSYFKISGFIDLVTQIDKDTIEIIDYKTGAKLEDFHTGDTIDYTYLHNDIQLRLYHLAIAEQYGCEKNYLLTLFYLQHSKPLTISFGCDDIIETKNKIKEKFTKIVNTKIPKLNRSWKCRKYCAFGKNTFENTHIKPITQFLNDGISNPGYNCTICDQITLEINRHSLEWVEKNMKNGKI